MLPLGNEYLLRPDQVAGGLDKLKAINELPPMPPREELVIIEPAPPHAERRTNIYMPYVIGSAVIDSRYIIKVDPQ